MGTRALLLAGAMALGMVSAATAADLPLPPPPTYIPPPPPEPVAFGGWYIRGDVGAGISMDDDIRSTFSPGATIINNKFVEHSRDDSAIFGLGVGYQWNNWLRFDATGEYRTQQKIHGLQQYDEVDGAGNDTGGIGYDLYTGKVQSSVFLANAYVDLGTLYGVTAYVGAGVGASYNVISGLTDFNTGGSELPNGTVPNPYNGYGSVGTAASNGKFNLAWAGMAGLTYSLTHNLKLDIGYRYLDMGNARSAAIACNQPGSACERQRYHLASSDIRVGLRWLFDDYVPPAPPPELPIIRKD